jgi:PAS domain S-box-containing protein
MKEIILNDSTRNISKFEQEFDDFQSTWENYQNVIKALKESEEKFRFFMDNSADVIWQLDDKFRYTYISPADEKLRGFSGEEMIGVSVWSILTEEGFKQVKNEISKRKELEENGIITGTARYEVQQKHRDGSLIWTEVNVNPIRDEDSKIIGYGGVTRDISERKKFAEEIQKKNDELRQLNESKDKFFSIISHDLRSPFQGLLGISKLLVEEFDSLSREEFKEFVVLLNDALHTQYKFLDDLLSWSRIQSGRLILEPENLPFQKELEKVLLIFDTNLKNKNISVTTECTKNIIVYSSVDMFSLLLRNLISNAIKFTKNGGHISINAKENKKEVLIEVKDNGIGIKKENLARLFRIDIHFSTSGTNKESGNGLGLVLCKEIIEKHGGDIWVESEPGKGTSFTFTLPKAK